MKYRHYKLTKRGYRHDWNEARRIHVFLLRCEGLSYGEIALRLGVTRQAVREMYRRAAHLLMWAWRRILQPHTMKDPECRLEAEEHESNE
jgi:transcriptional regulator